MPIHRRSRLGLSYLPQEASIFRDRLMADEPATLQEIGDKYGISRERVRQIEAQAIARIERIAAPKRHKPRVGVVHRLALKLAQAGIEVTRIGFIEPLINLFGRNSDLAQPLADTRQGLRKRLRGLRFLCAERIGRRGDARAARAGL